MTKKHKNDNVFKFKSFGERIQNVDLRKTALYHIEHVNETPDDNKSYFFQAVEKWSVLNLTDEFNLFLSKVRGVITLPQVLHQKERLIQLLLDRLDAATTLSLQPLLEFIVVLAKDLREEFYPYFSQFFEKLVVLLNSNDSDKTEWTLICLAFLFKTLKSFLRKDIQNVIIQITPLLDDSKHPEHVLNFAVECFSFIARDVRDKDNFLLMLLKIVNKDEKLVMGCGKLFFEMLKGLNGQFHSSGEAFLSTLLDVFTKPELKKYYQIQYEILVQTTGDLLDNIDVKFFETFWSTLYIVIDRILASEQTIEAKSESIKYLLNFKGQIIEYRSGKQLTDITRAIDYVVQIINRDLSEEVMLSLSQIGALLLLSNNFTLSQLDASRLAKKILSINHKEVFEAFVINSLGYSQFDILILPDFLKYLEHNFSGSTLEQLVKVVDQRFPVNDMCIEDWTSYSISFKQPSTIEKINNIVLSFDVEDQNGVDEFLLALHCLPHINNFDDDKVLSHLQSQTSKICGLLKVEDEPLHGKEQEEIVEHQKLLYLLTIVSVTLKRLSSRSSKKSSKKDHSMEVVNAILPYCKEPLYQAALNLLDIVLLDKSEKWLNQNLFEKIHRELSDNFLSQHQKVRMLTAKILTSFDHLKLAATSILGDNEEFLDDDSIYSIFHQIESIQANIHTYRDQVMLVQRLDYNSTSFQSLKDSPYKLDAMKFCLGFLHVNFQPLWKSIKDVLDTYSSEFKIAEFWGLFHTQLKSCIGCSENIDNEIEAEFLENEFLQKSYKSFWSSKNKVDLISYRIMLWKTLVEFQNPIYEAKNRDIVTLFLEFMKNEYEFDAEAEDAPETPKARQKLLISHLQVFAKITSAKHIYKEPEMNKLYNKFLLHRNFEVQKLALDCLMQYKHPYLVNYKDSLYNLMSEKAFKSELTSLNLNEKIQEEHREQFVNVLLTILYNKLTTKVFKKDNEGFKNKKEVITRFFSNLNEKEMVQLTKIAIEYLMDYMDDEPEQMRTRVMSSKKDAVKLNLLQSSLNFLDLVKKNVAGLFSTQYHKFLLQAVLCISCFASTPTDSAISKNLKQACQSSLVSFFEHFDNYEWSEEEIELIFELFVYDRLKTFSSDASQNVTGLMKLFIEWSKNPKYFKFFARTQDKDSDNNAIKAVVMLITNKNSALSVNEAVMDILERLLTMKEDEIVDGNINYGTELLKPFVHEILIKLKEYLSSKRLKTLNSRNLLILSRITELVADKESSKVLLDILFPLTLKKSIDVHADSESVLQLLTTISNLLNSVEQPKLFLRQMAPLFEHIHEVNLRKLLVKMFNQVFKDDGTLRNIINNFNAYDKRWIEQPNHEKRLSVFRKLDELMKKNKVTIDLAVLMLYHCFFFLKHEKDLAMRDNSSHYLKLVCLNIIQNPSYTKTDMDYFVDKVVLNLIQKRIRDEVKVRTEAIILLGELARNCKDVHPVLTDLHALTCEKNRELDFFDNITHLQKFRHMKGLRKFPEVAKTLTSVPNSKTLVEFLLPISRIYLCQEEYIKKSKVVEAAVDYVASICKFLPWIHYEYVLKYYIRKMKIDLTYQKQLIKLIPAILDAFHYDISAGVLDKILEDVPETAKPEAEVEIEDEEELDSENEDIETFEQDADVQETEDAKVLAIDQVLKLNPNAAKKVLTSLARRMVPALFRVINEQMSFDMANKLNKDTRRQKEKADMLRIPIALPIVKMLQKLPPKFMDDNLSQLLLKISSFLRSTLKQVRASARYTLRDILLVLGPSYVELILRHLKSILSQGFQVHVLSVTAHLLLDSVKAKLVPGEVDKMLQLLLGICLDDIFGRVGEDREAPTFGKRAPEAKPSKKSFLSLQIMATNVNEFCVLDMLVPFKTHLHETQSKKTVQKIQECLQRICQGFSNNPNIKTESLMMLVHGIVSESIPDLLPEVKKRFLTQADKERMKRAKNDSFIIQAEPKRRGAMTTNTKVRTNLNTNSHVLVEFGLELLQKILKRKTILQIEYQSYLDPLLPLLVDSLKSNFVRVNTFSVRCITSIWMNQLELSGMSAVLDEIVQQVFGILHKFAIHGVMKKDNNFLLMKNAFRAVITLLNKVNYYKVNENQLKTLILYVEQDLYNHDKETMVFTLLKSIIDKKLMIPEVHDIIKKVSEISITSDMSATRECTRPIILSYLMEYPVGKKIESVIKFYISQLNYELISGRDSAIEMLLLIFNNFPQVMLRRYSGLFFLSLGTRLVNDESPECRAKLADGLETLIQKIDNNPRQQLFELVLMMLKDSKLVHREMAAQLCTRFINAEGPEFIKRIPIILPALIKSMKNMSTDDENPENDNSGKFVRVKRQKLDLDEDATEEEENDQQSIVDHHLIQTLSTIIKIFELDSSLLQDEKFKQEVDEIGYQAHQLLSNDHVWIRLRALKIISLMLKDLDIEKIESEDKPREFMYNNKELKSIAFDMCVQVKPEIEVEILTLIMQNLLYVANILKEVEIGDVVNDKKDFNLLWLIRRLRYAVHAEIAKTPNVILLRKQIFQFFEALIALIDTPTAIKLGSSLFSPVMREMVEGEHVIEELKQLAIHVGNELRKKIGMAEYDKIRLELQGRMLKKRVERRKTLAQDKINDPAKAANRKIFKQLKKSEVKKRKRQSLQDGIVLPKRKRRTIEGSFNDTYE